MSAFSATSRAMKSGDLVRLDAKTANINEGFHGDVFDWLYFKGITIRLLNKRLASSTGESVDDLAIGGICDLILLEVRMCLETPFEWSKNHCPREAPQITVNMKGKSPVKKLMARKDIHG